MVLRVQISPFNNIVGDNQMKRQILFMAILSGLLVLTGCGGHDNDYEGGENNG